MNLPDITRKTKEGAIVLREVFRQEFQAVLLIELMHDFQDFSGQQHHRLQTLVLKRLQGFYLENHLNRIRQYPHHPGELGTPPLTLRFPAFVDDSAVHILAQVQIHHHLGEGYLLNR